jgi:hypothetical protein
MRMRLTKRKNVPVSIGSRYRRPDLPHAVWEVLAIYSGSDDRHHAVLFNVDDITWHKTLTVAELENEVLYESVVVGA